MTAEDDYSRRVRVGGSLDGKQVPNASSVAVDHCPSGDTVGVDLLDLDGQPFAHAHFGLDDAIGFHQALGAKIVELAIATGAAEDPTEKETKH